MMKSRILSRLSGITLIWVLIFQVAFGTQFASHAFAGGSNDLPAVSGEINTVDDDQIVEENSANPGIQDLNAVAAAADAAQAQYEQSGELPAPPAAKNFQYMLNQKHIVFAPSEDGTTDVPVAEYSLNDYDTKNPRVEILDPEKELKYVVVKGANELRIDRVVPDKKLGRNRITDRHVISGLQITSNIVDQQDPNYVFFASEDGVHAILKRELRTALFAGAIPAPVLAQLPPLSTDRSSGTITNIETINRAMKPQDLGGEELAVSGDLLVTHQDGSKSVLSEAELNMNASTAAFERAAMALVADTDLDGIAEINGVLRDNEADYAQYESRNQEIIADPAAMKLTTSALSNAWRFGGLKNTLAWQKKDASGLNQFQAQAKAPKDIFRADAWPGSEWSQDFQKIQKSWDFDKQINRARRPWRQALVDAVSNADEKTLQERALQEQSLLKRMSQRMKTLYTTHVTARRLKVLGVTLAALAANKLAGGTPGEWVLSGLSHIFEVSTQIPIIGALTGPVVKSAGFFADHWGTFRVMLGLSVVLSFRPLSLLGGALKAMREKGGESVNKFLQFFRIGIKGYAYASYPAQKVAIWDRLGQKNLYDRVFAKGLNPFEYKAQAFNSPFANEEDINAKADQLTERLKAERVRAQRAKVIAATIVSETYAADGSDIDMISLILESETPESKQELFKTMAVDPTKSSRWLEMSELVYSELTKINDGTDGSYDRIDEELIGKYYSIYKKAAARLEAMKAGDGRILLGLKKSAQRLRTFFSERILQFALFGKQGYFTYKKYKDVVVDKKTAAIAGEQYKGDYDSSSIYYALVDPAKFADIPLGGHGAPEVITNQLSQIFIYGVQGAVDPLTAADAETLVNANGPIVWDLMAKDREKHQTFGEALKAIGASVVDPEGKSFLANHAQYILNTADAFQVRFLADYATRASGMYLTHGGGVWDILKKTSKLSTAFLLAKISFAPGAVGYATVWPYIHLASRQMKNVAEKNKTELLIADALLDRGVRLDDVEARKAGVALMKSLFAQGKKDLPQEFKISEEEYSPELAAKLFQYSRENIPLATRDSNRMNLALNVGLGAGVSTVLFDAVSGMMFRDGANAGEILARTGTAFVGTYLALKVASHVAPFLLKGARSVVRSCRDLLIP